MNGSVFGAYAQPQGQGGMFGQQQSPLMQMMGGAGGMNPQMMQALQMMLAIPPTAPGGFVPGADGEGLVRSPYEPTFPEQYNAGPGMVPGTSDQKIMRMVPPQNLGATGAFGGIPPEILRILLGPRSI